MTHLMTQEDIATIDAEEIPLAFAGAGEPHLSTPLPGAEIGERTTRIMRVEDMFGILAEAIDREFLEIVLGCRGRALPKDVLP